MSRTAPSDMQQLALTLRCSRCNARAGLWCITTSGAWADYPHGDRDNALYSAYRLGYEQAESYKPYWQADMLRELASLVDLSTGSTDPAAVARWLREKAERLDPHGQS